MDVGLNMDSEIQTEKDNFNNMDAKSNMVLESIDETYNKDGDNELNEDKLQQAVLNVPVPTLIANARASESCGQPSISNCGRYKLDDDLFIATG